MWVDQLRLVQFRNLDHVTVSCSPRLNLFLGPNASGKTSILEALVVLSRGRSPRTASDREFIRWEADASLTGQQESRVSASVHQDKLDMSFTVDGTWIQPISGRFRSQFRVNQQPLKSRSALLGHFPTVTFFLSDLLLLRGAPADRRSALDALVGQWRPVAMEALTTYQRLRDQKAALLKQALKQGVRPADGVLDTIDEQLMVAGLAVMTHRLSVLHALQPLMQPYWEALSTDHDPMAIRYWSSLEAVLSEEPEGVLIDPAQWEAGEAQLKSLFEQALLAARPDEWRRGQVLVGPHRDDFRAYIKGHDACAFASQGQQRSVILALKLAEIQLLTQAYGGESPVLLLDDVMAELDPYRQQQLIRHVDPTMQVLLTTTHLDDALKAYVNQVSDVRVFHVDHGHVQPQDADEAGLLTTVSEGMA